MKLLLDLVANNTLPLDELVTHNVRWSELESIYKLAKAGDKEMIAAVLNWKES